MKKFIYLCGLVLSIMCFTTFSFAADTFDGYVVSDSAVAFADVVAVGDGNEAANELFSINLINKKLKDNLDLTMVADVVNSKSSTLKTNKQNAKQLTCNQCHAYNQNRPD